MTEREILKTSEPNVPLTVAGSDPSGGAGIEADLKVFLRHGLSGASVITALTSQGPSGVRDVTPVKTEAVRARLCTLLDEMPIAAIKTGLMPSARMVSVIAKTLKGLRNPIVVDPVVRSSSGFIFLDGEGVRAVRDHLLPLATIVVPNLDEAALLCKLKRSLVEEDPMRVIKKLHGLGARWVLLKGGHASGSAAIDYLSDGRTTHELRLPRLPIKAHGTGCALSAAIAARLTLGENMLEAVLEAKRYVHRALSRARMMAPGQAYLEFTA
jgi:hydroxymethylpyrimidine/phosphomethylpyrimidine kinase